MRETSPAERSVPDGWHEVQNPDFIVEKYDPRTPTLFEREGEDVAVHALPDEPQSPHADRQRWRVGYVEGNAENLEHVEPFAHREGRENALHVAYEFMAAYNEHDDLPREERVDRAEEEAAEA